MASCANTLSAFGRVVVVDNASTDDTRTTAREAGLEVVSLPRNLGLAAAVNLGVEQTEGDDVALLNPDVRLEDADAVERLQEHLVDPLVGVVAPALVLPTGELQDSARRVPSPADLALRRILGRTPDAVRATAPVGVDWAVGAFLVVRRSAFEAVAGLNEKYFLYFEDVDLGVRMRAAGYRVLYDPTVRVFHEHRAASRSSLTSREARAHFRSAFTFYLRNPRFLLPRPSYNGNGRVAPASHQVGEQIATEQIAA